MIDKWTSASTSPSPPPRLPCAMCTDLPRHRASALVTAPRRVWPGPVEPRPVLTLQLHIPTTTTDEDDDDGGG